MPTVDVPISGSALLVPGVAGRAEVLAAERRSLLVDLRDALAAVPPVVDGSVVDGSVVDHASGAPRGAVTVLSSGGSPGRPVPDLGPVGVAAHRVGWSFHGNDDAPSGSADVATSVALLALGAAGWDAPVDVVAAGPGLPEDSAAARTLAGGGAVVRVVTGGSPVSPVSPVSPAAPGAAVPSGVPFVVAVVGPTATGKSDLALDLAERLGASAPGGAEIVNADAFQLYRGMDVGTAKVPAGQRRGIVHHQLDVVDPEDDASVARYQEEARADLDAIAARGAVAVVVGGSGLYVRALLDVMDFPGTDPDIRAALEVRAETEGRVALHTELARLDPLAAASIGPQNTRRIVRALEVVELTGRPFTATLPRQEYVRPAVQIGLDCDRDVLDARVAGRVERMWREGLVAEVEALAPRLGRTASRAVGYAEVLDVLTGARTQDAAREAVVTNTRRLARKQMGWFGRDPRVTWLDAQAPDLADRALAVLDAARRADVPGGPLAGVGPADGGAGDDPVRRSLGS